MIYLTSTKSLRVKQAQDMYQKDSVQDIEIISTSESNYSSQTGTIKAKGKFLFQKEKKFWVRGVTYGTFQPDEAGEQYPDKDQVRFDFNQMLSNNINTVRVYTVPPIWLLDIARESGLYVMVGLPWEQHITFLDDNRVVAQIKNRVQKSIQACKNHPAILCYTIGNEIPPGIVRWYGAKKIEKFLESLYLIVKKEAPESLVSYVNFPPTEYLQLPFLDLFCFNVYLENKESLENYLGRLQNLSAEKPLILAEIGLDSQRNGEDIQAEVLDWQIKTIFKKGAAGVLVFSWTDEWYRGGYDILDWDFGLTTRERKPKKALPIVKNLYNKTTSDLLEKTPMFTVAVCTYNGSSTLDECLSSLEKLNYPNFEIVVVNDGSTDSSETIAKSYACRLISTPNRGLSNARNTAWKEGNGEIIVYIDDDAYADPDWLSYLALSFQNERFAAVGGPNIPPLDADMIARAVANAPGGPIHVLISDEEAEHIPGCNMAFRKSALEKVGGFDPIYRAAGDDVDMCWKILEEGWSIGFSPSAVVWHHRRNKISTYWKQQKGYGKAEALLETKWPQKFNHVGHLRWGGRLYSPGIIRPLIFPRWKIAYGTWGTGLFQSLYERDPHKALWIPLMPEWYALIGLLVGISCLGVFWTPLLWFSPFAILAIGIAVAQAVISTYLIKSKSTNGIASSHKIKLKILTCYLFLLQPLARLWGRLEFGLTLWRRRHKASWALPKSSYYEIWSEHWKSQEHWLKDLVSRIHQKGVITKSGGEFDAWDLEVREGLSIPTRIVMVIEEHGNGNQLIRFRTWPVYKIFNILTVFFFLVLTLFALIDKAWIAAVILGIFVLISVSMLLRQNLPVILSCFEEAKKDIEKMNH